MDTSSHTIRKKSLDIIVHCLAVGCEKLKFSLSKGYKRLKQLFNTTETKDSSCILSTHT